MIFWDFVEIMGRWNLFHEVWVHPTEHWLENSLLLGLLVFFTTFYLVKGRRDRQRRSRGSMLEGERTVERIQRMSTFP
ncbi:MAG: hypothetical protein QM724_04295 [Flavobacteriales bacterium]